MFQYPLRVLGCEKTNVTIGDAVYVKFQYPLRVLGCEKPAHIAAKNERNRFSTLCGFLVVRSWARRVTMFRS